jgi:hypothetical protein
MKRNLDLSRSILAFVEEQTPPQGGLDKPLQFEGYDRPTVLAHAELLIEEGLLHGKVLKAGPGIVEVMIFRLSPQGHDAVAATRSDTLWQMAKERVAERGGALTFSVVVEFALAEARRQLGLP